MVPGHLVLVPRRSRAAYGTGAHLRFLTQRALDRLVVSDYRIAQSHLLLGQAHQAQARTHALGVAYADWRLRRDLLAQERALTGGIG